jgi:cytoskeletal protein CcmA (bactofilin family)
MPVSGPMSEAPKRRFGDRGNGPPTVIGEGVELLGDIRAPGALMLSGSVKGDGEIGGTLSISRGAHWEGEIKVHDAVIAGRVTGAITVEGKLELGAQAVIRGRVSAKSLAIARGAVIEGDILVTSGAPIVQFEEKRESTMA